MRDRYVQALDLSSGFSDFGKLAWWTWRSGWACVYDVALGRVGRLNAREE